MGATPTIESISPLPFPGMTDPLSTTQPIVVVLVEARLLNHLPAKAPAVSDLEQRLLDYHLDLRDEGFDARTVSVRMRRGGGHLDGAGVLAIRELFQNLYATHPNFAGAVLVGSFPEAMLVRRFVWKKTSEDVTINGTLHADVDVLFMIPQVIAERTDLVLSDLDGKWEQLYQPGPITLHGLLAIPSPGHSNWPVDDGLFTSSQFEWSTHTFEDFFWIRDDDFADLSLAGASNLTLRLRRARRNPECSAADRAQANPIARPEINVSRINARNVAVMPDPAFIDTTGKGFLDASGKPQPVTMASTFPDMWKQDPAFERRLLIDFFDRNHQYRRGDYYFAPFRAAAISSSAFTMHWQVASGMAKKLEEASSDFAPSVVAEKASLLEFVRWMKKPATFRGLMTHAGHDNSLFDPVDYEVSELEDELGGPPWRWKLTSAKTLTYEPSLDEQDSKGDFYVYRSLWENGSLGSTGPAFFLHNGCFVNSPSGAWTAAYDSPHYAVRQEAESELFYLNGLAIGCRAKEFNDSLQRDFPTAFGAPNARFGDGLTAYFDAETKDASLGAFDNDVKAKRAYFWSVVGDWTLQLRYWPKAVLKFVEPPVAVRPLERRWLVTDGFVPIKVLPDEEQATRVTEVVNRLGVNQRYLIGGDDGGWEYYLDDGRAPSLDDLGDIGTGRIELGELTVDNLRDRWVVRSGQEAIASFTDRLLAEAVIGVLHTYEATSFHWIGERADPAMTFFTA